MRFADFLAEEWRPALGCTEPASIAYAACLAAGQQQGELLAVRLVCDPRIYKNCYAVGIPHSGHQVGIRWALALGCHLPDAAARLECFRQITPPIIEAASQMLERDAVAVEVDRGSEELLVDCLVTRQGGTARVVIEQEHTRVVRVERDGQAQPTPGDNARAGSPSETRRALAELPFEQLMDLARQLSAADRAELRRGIQANLAMAKHGLSLFPRRFVDMTHRDQLTRISRLVCAGVYARMWGEDLVVMSLSGSGNKGITTSVPVALWGQHLLADAERVDEALALAGLVTSATTHHLGPLSAVCGCSNAAGIGLACGLVLLEDGGPAEISLAVNNMVGNVTGMICDGAKIGCALKTMTAVDAAFRASTLALAGIGIPESDGIVGRTGQQSLANLGRVATTGMESADREVQAIMQQKLET